MGVYNEAGTRQTKSGLPTTPYTEQDPVFTVTARLTRKSPYYGAESGAKTEGTKEQVLANAGDLVTQSQIDSWFPAVDVTSVTPATGPAAGGTVLTLRGENLDGVTAVTVGGVATTALTYVSPSEMRVTTGAHAAGAVSIVLTDDSGSKTETGLFTYV